MREAFVYRHWQQLHGRYGQRHLLEEDADPGADVIGVWALLSLVLVVPLDLALLDIDWQPALVRRLATLPGLPLVLFLSGLLGLNALRADRQLRRWAPGGGDVILWVRLARALLFSVPLAAVIAVPAWARVVKRWPGRFEGLMRHGPAAGVSLRGGSQGLAHRALPPRMEAALVGIPGVVAWYLVDIAVASLGVLWLAAASPASPGRCVAIWCLAAAIHILAAAIAWAVGRVRITRLRLVGNRRLFATWLPVLCLAPAPLSLLPCVLNFAGDSRSSESLVWTGFVSHNQPERTTVGWKLRRLLRKRREHAGWRARWTDLSGETRMPEVGVADHRLRELIYGKALLSFGDGLIAGWTTVALADGLGKNVAGSISWADPFVLFPFALAGSGLLLAGVGYLGTLLRIPACVRLARQPYADSLLWVGWALGLGALVGKALAGGAVREGLALVAVGSFLPILSSAIGFTLRPTMATGSPRLREIAWVLSPLVWAALAVGYSRPDLWPEIATGIVILTPLWHFLLALTLGRWLLWPFGFRDVAARELPPWQRRLLAFLTATLVLPGGGLAAPAWIYVRQRFGPDLGRRTLTASKP